MEADSRNIYALPRNLVLAASAGTGKTHALVGVVLHLLVTDRLARSRGRAEPIDPSRIVATTFSRKAAAEIRGRVASELERLAMAPAASPYVESLRAALLSSGPAGKGLVELDDSLRQRARRALPRLTRARFGTLHSFATGIVKAHAVELGLGPGFELASESEARTRAEEAIARALEAKLGTSEVAVRSLAEAAGGLDRLVTQFRRVLVALEEDGRSAHDLAISADDARAIDATFATFVDHARSLVAAPKFELAAKELSSAWERGNQDALEPAAVALCAIPALGKKTPEVEGFAVFRKTLPGITNEEKGRRLARLFRMRHEFGGVARLARDVLGAAEVEIERGGRAAGAIGFGEVLRAARELLRDRPDVAEEVGAAIDALLVDEFQDTSRVQRDLLQLVWARSEGRAVGKVPTISAVRTTGLLVVGDRKQSIYGFRGADVGVFAELAVGLAGRPAREALGIPAGVTWEPREPSADFFALRHNRRSVPEVLAFANAFSARRFRPGEPPPELFEVDYVPATEDLLVPPERLDATPASDSGRQSPITSEGTRARTVWLRVRPSSTTSTRLEEALVIASRIASVIAEAAIHVGRDQRAPTYRDIAVLAATNGMLDATAFALARASIPYVVAGKSFFRAREVRDLGAMLALVLDPEDKLAALEVLRGPWVSAHDETLLGLTREGAGLRPPYAWSNPPFPALVHDEDRQAIADAAAVIMDLSRSAARLGPGTILREAVRACAFDDVLASLPRGEQRVANVRKLLALADRHDDARRFLKWLDDAAEHELPESEAATFAASDDAVRLLTIHASKGLDFPIVFVPEVGAPPPRPEKGALRIAIGAADRPNEISVRAADERGLVLEPPSFGASHAMARRRERAERQRLAYVAITRAAEAMFFVGGRAKEGVGEQGASTLAVLEEMAGDDVLRAATAFDVEDVPVPEPTPTRDAARTIDVAKASGTTARTFAVPRWRSLPIAPTALADFEHCPRRFELVHLLGLPEHARGARPPAAEAAPTTVASPGGAGERAQLLTANIDARAQGTLAHAVLEHVPADAFAGTAPASEASRALTDLGLPVEHPQHDVIVSRVARFLEGSYARALVAAGAEVRREVPFALPIEDDDGRSVILRGSMDLVVVWPDGSVDVVDYKSARGGAQDAYALQLDVYGLAARALFPNARRFRVGLVYLGGSRGAEEPLWRAEADDAELRARLAAMGNRLVTARWTGTFARVALERCEAIHCGFIGRCHAAGPSDADTSANGVLSNGTHENAPAPTTT